MTGVKWEKAGFPGVYKRPSARKPGKNLYRHVYRDLTGRQVACSRCHTFDAARKHQAEMVNERPHDVAAGRRTVREVYEELADRREYAAATLEFHETAWRLYLSDLAEIPVKDVTGAHVEHVLKSIPKAAMRDKVRVFLSTVFGFAMRRHYINANPVPRPEQDSTRAARMRRESARTVTPRYLEPEQVARLAGEVPDRWRAMIYLMAYQGLRPGEAVSLTVGKFDPLKRTLLIDTSISGFTKTGRARTLVLPAPLAEMLAAHLATFTDPSNPDGPMFPKDDGAAITTKNAYDAWSRRVFGPAADRAGINGGFSPNDLRHSAASFAIAKGANVYDVQEMLGHAKASITLDIYGERWKRSREEHAERMEPAIREALAITPSAGEVVPIRR